MIECGCAYSLICNMMMWHVRIGGVKLGFYTTSEFNLIWKWVNYQFITCYFDFVFHINIIDWSNPLVYSKQSNLDFYLFIYFFCNWWKESRTSQHSSSSCALINLIVLCYTNGLFGLRAREANSTLLPLPPLNPNKP